jgi:hypothetical protein
MIVVNVKSRINEPIHAYILLLNALEVPKIKTLSLNAHHDTPVNHI